MTTLIDRLKGAMTALVTPFDDRDQVDTAALTRFVQKQLEQGIDGLVPCGTTGETPALSDAEQETVVRTVVEVAGGKVPIIAGTGHNSTRVTVEQTKRAAGWGIDAALVVVPYYNKPTQEGIYRHFKAVHDETGVPAVAYNVPGRTAVDMMPETLGRLAEEGAVIGIKDATANMIRTADNCVAVGRDRPFAMLSGDDFTLLPFVATGGRGVISVVSNVAPKATSQLIHEAAKGNYEVARPLNDRIIALTRALFLSSNPIPVKAGVALCGFGNGRVRLPLVTADDDLVGKVRAALERFRGEAGPLEGWLG